MVPGSRQLRPGSGKRHHVSEQTQRDAVRLNDRIRRNASRMAGVELTLDQFCGRRTMIELLAVAQQCVIALNGTVQIDRLARRSRPALMCWFCENWSVVWEQIYHFYGGHPQPPTANLLDFTQLPRVGPIARTVDEDIDIGPVSLLTLLNH